MSAIALSDVSDPCPKRSLTAQSGQTALETPAEKAGVNKINGLEWLTALTALAGSKGLPSAVTMWRTALFTAAVLAFIAIIVFVAYSYWPDAGASFLSQAIFRKPSSPDPILAAMIAKFRQFMADESGATAIEYGLIAAGIAVAIIAVVNGLGTQLKATFSKVTSSLAAQ